MTDTTVKYFDSEMTGAAPLSGTAGSLVAILRECLVTGRGLAGCTISVAGGVATAAISAGHSFVPGTVALVAEATPAALNGEKRILTTGTGFVTFDATGVSDGAASGTITIKLAAAGWIETFSGGNKIALKSSNPASSGCVMRIDDTGTRNARLRAYDAMTDIDTGTGPTPTESQVSGGLYIAKSNNADAAVRRWAVIANDAFAILLTAYHGSFGNDYAIYAFGDIQSVRSGDAYRATVMADSSDQSSQQYVANQCALTSADSSVGCYFVRSYVGSGGAVAATVRKPGLQSGSGSPSLPPGPNPISNVIEVCPTLIFEGASLASPRRGVVPGVYGVPHSLGSGFDSKDRLTAAVGMPGHTIAFFRYMTQSAPAGWRFAVDISGPWE